MKRNWKSCSGSILLAVVLAGCTSRSTPSGSTVATSPVRIEIASPSVQVETVAQQDMELIEIRQQNEILTPRYDISGSGLGTHQGAELPPIHVLSIVGQSPPREMRLHLHLASTHGFINRSGLRWSGDFIPGVRFATRMYDRDTGGDGKVGKMAAVLHVQLPGRSDFDILFLNYNADCKLIPYFGKRPFADYAKRISDPKVTDEKEAGPNKTIGQRP